jgi:transcriptional regulator with XRE-family HTH domain
MKIWINMPEGVMRKARLRRGLSVTDVAKSLGVSLKTYDRWERADRIPGNMVTAVAGVLNLDIELPEKARVVLEDRHVELGHQPTMAELHQRLEAIEALLLEMRRGSGNSAAAQYVLRPGS